MSSLGATPGGPQQSSAKKRRLAALENRATAAVPSSSTVRERTPSARSASPAVGAATRSSGNEAPSTSDRVPAMQQAPVEPIFPYARLAEGAVTEHIAAQLQLPPAGQRQGSIDDLLEQLMTKKLTVHAARAAIGSRLVNKTIMIDNPVARLVSAGQPANKHKHAAGLLKRERRLSIADIPSATLSFAALQPLHQLWQQYMAGLLLLPLGRPPAVPPGTQPATPEDQLQQRLQEADLHGCLLSVVSSRDPQLVGRQGVVVKAGANAFHIVSQQDRLHVIPKQGSEMQFELADGRVVTLQGSSLLAQKAKQGKGPPARQPSPAAAVRR